MYQSSVNFQTPKNRDFYAQNLCQRLNSSRREIRLLRLHPKQLSYSEVVEKFPQWKNSSGVLKMKRKLCDGKPIPPPLPFLLPTFGGMINDKTKPLRPGGA